MTELHLPTGTVSRRAFLTTALGSAAAVATLAAAGPAAALGAAGSAARTTGRTTGPELATDWVRTLYDVVMAEGLTPPGAARFYHYTSVTMYEAARSGRQPTLAGQLTGLGRLPVPRQDLDSGVVLSEAVSAVALGLLPAAAQGSRDLIVAHRERVIGAASTTSGRRDRIEAGRRHGQQLAADLLAWMTSDGAAEASARPYTPPVGPDLWRSTPPNFGTAIDPYWSLVRPAILTEAGEVEPEPPVPFSTEVGSAFYEQAMVTYRQSAVNTDDQIAIARFWTDNPRLSGLPSGHWFLLLASLAADPLGLDLHGALEGFARLGVALHDAFLNCWTWKYRYNLIRPVSYVQDHIDPAWTTLVNTPQFPEYTSGHSVASGAAAVVLTELYGDFAFTDSTGLPRNLAARNFSSFTDAADEAAQSRLYGGIHYPMGIENGVAQGREIGTLVNRRLRTRTGGR